MSKVETKITLKEAQKLGNELTKELSPYIEKSMIAGSIRRECEEIGDIDIVIIPKESLFDNIDNIIDVTSGGQKKIFGEYKGRPINLFFTDEKSWGAQLMTSTGPAQYNIRKRFLVKRKGLKLSEYGLFDRNSGEYISGRTETDIYVSLGWSIKCPTERK
jgi:DNA polymerase (family 10)